jgi:hypothetical protein
MKPGDPIKHEHDWRFVQWTSSSKHYAIVRCSVCEVEDLFTVASNGDLVAI